MKVKLKIGWGSWSKGHVFTEMPGGQARTLISRGIAEEVDDKPGKRSAPVNRMASPGKTKKGRAVEAEIDDPQAA